MGNKEKENVKDMQEREGMKMEQGREGPSEGVTKGADLRKELEEKTAELEKCQDKVLRLAAELENFKKRIEREKAEHMKYALEAFAKELLPFLDNLERAVDAAKESKDIDKLIDGLELTLSGYLKTLERFGLKVFASEGQRFDPNLHEALTVEMTDEFEDNTVIKQLLKGYTLHEKVLRPALVIVSKKNKKEGGQGETSA